MKTTDRNQRCTPPHTARTVENTSLCVCFTRDFVSPHRGPTDSLHRHCDLRGARKSRPAGPREVESPAQRPQRKWPTEDATLRLSHPTPRAQRLNSDVARARGGLSGTALPPAWTETPRSPAPRGPGWTTRRARLGREDTECLAQFQLRGNSDCVCVPCGTGTYLLVKERGIRCCFGT